MSHPHGGSLSGPDISGQSKFTLYIEPPGRIGMLVDRATRKSKTKRFSGLEAALAWAVKEQIIFICLPKQAHAKN